MELFFVFCPMALCRLDLPNISPVEGQTGITAVHTGNEPAGVVLFHFLGGQVGADDGRAVRHNAGIDEIVNSSRYKLGAELRSQVIQNQQVTGSKHLFGVGSDVPTKPFPLQGRHQIMHGVIHYAITLLQHHIGNG